jgi:sugar-specific transcriptional regulator TrmB
LLAEKTKVPPTAVYPTTKSLVKKNLIQEFSGEVKEFEALPPKLAIPTIIEEKRKELLEIEQETLKEIEKIKQEPQSLPQKDILTLSLGQKASVTIYENSIKNAKKSIYILGWRMHKVKDKYTFLQHFKEPIKKKVDVRLLLTGGPEKAWDLINAYKRTGIKVKYFPLEKDKFTLFTVDGEECKMTLKDKTLPEKYNIHVHDTSLAEAMQSYFLDCWEKAQELPRKSPKK